MLLRRCLGGVTAIILSYMMVLTVVDVFGRFFLNKPIPGSFEMMEFSLAILVFAAMPLVTWDRGHVSVTLLDGIFKGAGKKFQQIVVLAGSALAMAIIAWRMRDQGNRLDITGAITGYLEWPIAPVAYFMAALAAFSLIILLILIWFVVVDRDLPEFDDHEMEMSE